MKNLSEIALIFPSQPFGRILLLDKFIKYLNVADLNKDLDVAIIGGLKSEPELNLLELLGYNLKIDFYGIGDNEFTLDLNIKNSRKDIKKVYDLVICCQVLEHIWNTNNFFKNIELFKSDKTLIYLNFPKSNKFHSIYNENHTDFNSSGYSKYFILNNIKETSLIPVEVDEIGSERLYKSIHVLQTWYNYDEIIKCFRSEKKQYIKYFISPYNLVNYFLLKKCSNKASNNPNFTTETYCFLK